MLSSEIMLKASVRKNEITVRLSSVQAVWEVTDELFLYCIVTKKNLPLLKDPQINIRETHQL